MKSTDHIDYCDNLKTVPYEDGESEDINLVLVGLSIILLIVLIYSIIVL